MAGARSGGVPGGLGQEQGARSGVPGKNRGRARGPKSAVQGRGAGGKRLRARDEVSSRRPAPETSPRPAAYRPLRRWEGRGLDTRWGGAPRSRPPLRARSSVFPRLLLGPRGPLNGAWRPARGRSFINVDRINEGGAEA